MGMRINLVTVILIGTVCLILGCAATTKITSEPDGASIYLNRVFIGTTPLLYKVKDIFGPGSIYGFTAEKAGYRTEIINFREVDLDDASIT